MAAPTRNRLLAALPKAEHARILRELEMVELHIKTSLHEPDDPTPFVYFPESGVLSLLTVLAEGMAVELGHVGNEGMVDITVFLWLESSESRTIVQVPGLAGRLSAERFRELVREMPDLDRVIGAYVLEFFTMVAQTTACNRRHTFEQRFARWVLMTQDRVGEAAFPITQDFLAEMLGVSRPNVTVAAIALQDAGVIAYHRGRMRAIGRVGLERATCECYALIRDRFARFEASPVTNPAVVVA